ECAFQRLRQQKIGISRHVASRGHAKYPRFRPVRTMPRPSMVRRALLTRGWLPKLERVSVRIDDPAEFAKFGLFDLVLAVHTLRAKGLQQGMQIFDPVVDHERRRARREVFRVGGKRTPGRRSDAIRIIRSPPSERRAAPFLHVDPEVRLVPGAQGLWIPGFEEDSTDSRYAFHDESPELEMGGGSWPVRTCGC